MGMRETQLLRRVELPIAAPAIIAGVRIAAVQVVATATLAALVGGGALGRYIVDGFALRQQDMLVAGAVLVAGLALLTERSFTFLERAARLARAGANRERPGRDPQHAQPAGERDLKRHDSLTGLLTGLCGHRC